MKPCFTVRDIQRLTISARAADCDVWRLHFFFLIIGQVIRRTIQETKIDSSISTSELFSESCPYCVYRKDRTLNGGGVMLLIHKGTYFVYAHHITGK